MPIARITLAKGKSAEYLAAISKSVYDAMREAFLLEEGDLFHIFEQPDMNAFIYDRHFNSADPRTDDFMIINILSDARRKEHKIATFKAICEKLGSSPGVKPQDIVVTFSTNNTLEDFSLGYGISVDDMLG